MIVVEQLIEELAVKIIRLETADRVCEIIHQAMLLNEVDIKELEEAVDEWRRVKEEE